MSEAAQHEPVNLKDTLELTVNADERLNKLSFLRDRVRDLEDNVFTTHNALKEVLGETHSMDAIVALEVGKAKDTVEQRYCSRLREVTDAYLQVRYID